MRLTLKEQHFELTLKLRRQGLSYRAISSEPCVSKTQIHKWLCNFADEPLNGNIKMKKSNTCTPASSESASTADANEIKCLKSELVNVSCELAYHKLRAEAYDELINVAEGKFNIAIRKKAGAKQ